MAAQHEQLKNPQHREAAAEHLQCQKHKGSQEWLRACGWWRELEADKKQKKIKLQFAVFNTAPPYHVGRVFQFAIS